MKFGIVGAGAIGLTLGAQLAACHDVLILARRAEVAGLLERNGITVTGDGTDRTVAVRATVDPAAFGDREAVLIAVKAHATSGAVSPLRGILRPTALVVSLQNGIDNVRSVREALPEARIVAGSTTQGAIASGDGRVRPVNRGITTFARSDDVSPTSAEIAGAFSAAGLDARVEDDVDLLLWRKLVVNAAINPLCGLTGRTNGDAVGDPDLAPLARALAAEAAQVAAAEGIAIGDPWAAVEAAAEATAANRNSMLQDLDAGRRTEIDAISGAIVQRAGAHGIAVPLTEAMLRLVHARERRP